MSKNKPQIEDLPVTSLVPYAKNSRTHSDEQVAQVAASIKEFGFTNPILVDGDNVLIAGHGRLLAAQRLGLNEVPCIRLSHLTESQKRAYVIADNKLAINAEWDEELLKLALIDLEESDLDVTLTGFNDLELDELMQAELETQELEQEDTELPKALQLTPRSEYCVIFTESIEEWEELKECLNLTPVRRGGYKKRSAFGDATGTQSVIKASEFFNIIKSK